jgi:ketosteroid isomerase-like protein
MRDDLRVVEESGSREELTQINVGIGDAEKRQDATDLEPVLHDDLVFRRADGKLISKQQYLDAVPTRVYERLDADVVEIHEKDESAVVTVIVDAAGTTADGSRFDGRFRNVRVFVKDDGRWLCRLWVNTPASANT